MHASFSGTQISNRAFPSSPSLCYLGLPDESLTAERGERVAEKLSSKKFGVQVLGWTLFVGLDIVK